MSTNEWPFKIVFDDGKLNSIYRINPYLFYQQSRLSA